MDIEMVNWLEEVRKVGGEWAWIWKRRPFLEQWQSRSQLLSHEDVLKTSRVKEAVTVAALRRKISEREAFGEAEAILSQMVHQFHMGYVRPIGYSVIKVIMRLYSSIFVNLANLESIKAAAYQSGGDPIPIVFLPTHRSYLDFLLITLICYHVECPLPAIAAGEDFLTSRFLGESLRRCGAFFLRRQFGNDPLYWAVFSEYVRLLLTQQHGRPLEFFLEGQRSRTLKSLHPKTGLLQLVVEPFLKAELYDILLVPVSIDYDKILEESLYAYELLGSPKPKETTSGLFKARQILQQSYGNVYVRFGETISLRQYFLTGGVDPRREYALAPRDKFVISPCQREKINSLAYRIMGDQNANKTLTLWPLICACIIQRWMETNCNSLASFHYSNLMDEVRSLARLCEKLGVKVQRLGADIGQDMRYFLSLHSTLVKYEEGLVEFPSSTLNAAADSGEVPAHLVVYLTLLHYSNPLLASLAPIASAAVAIAANGAPTLATIEKEWSLLRTIFNSEFVMVPSTGSILSSTMALENAGLLRMDAWDEKRVYIVDPSSLFKLARLYLPYLASYCELMKVIGSVGEQSILVFAVPPSAEVIRLVRAEVSKHLGVGVEAAEVPNAVRRYATAAVSSELIKNAYGVIANGGMISDCIGKLESIIEALLSFAEPIRSKL